MEIKVQDKTYVIKKPDVAEINSAKKFASVRFSEYVRAGVMLRDELDSILLERGFQKWNKEKEEQLTTLSDRIEENLTNLSKKSLAKTKKVELAKETRALRVLLNLLKNEQSKVYSHTVENKVDDDYFDFLVSECVFNEEGERVFSSFEDYQEKSGEEFAIRSAEKLAEVMFGLKDNWQAELPENKFLLDQGLLDENLALKEEE
jgi:hypothetical protein